MNINLTTKLDKKRWIIGFIWPRIDMWAPSPFIRKSFIYIGPIEITIWSR